MKERMLFLSAYDDQRLDPEGEMRTRKLIDILLEKYNIDLIEYSLFPCAQGIRNGQGLNVHRVIRNTSDKKPLLPVLNLPNGGAMPPVVQKALRNEISGLVQKHAYTHVFISSPLLGNCIDLITSLAPDAIIVTDAHRLKRSALGKVEAARGIGKPLHRINAALLRREERRLMNKTSLLLTASEWDALSYKALSFSDAGKVHVVPPFIDLTEYSLDYGVSDGKDNSIVLNWNMDTVEGKNAVLTFYRKIYPIIKADIPECRCYAIGGDEAHPEVIGLEKSDSSFRVVRDRGSAKEYIRRARAAIAVIRSECGSPLKVLEAWALKTPVVIAQQGSEQMDCEPNRNILLASTSSGMAEQVVKLLRQPEFGSIISEQAHRTLLKHYEADIVKAKVLSIV